MVHYMDTNSTVPEIKRYVGFSLPSRRGLYNKPWKVQWGKGWESENRPGWKYMWLNKESVDMITFYVEPLKPLSACSCFYVLIEKKWSLNIYCIKRWCWVGISMWLRLSYCTFYPISAAMELGPCSVNTEDRAMTLKFCFSKHWYSDDLQDGDRKELLVDWMARRGRFSIILCKCKIDISAYSMFLFGGVTLSSVRNLGCQKVVNQTC